MAKKLVLVTLVVLLAAAGLGISGPEAAKASPAKGGGIFYESQPDEVALYLSDIAFVRDTVTLPADQEVRVLLPPGTYINTLLLTENGERVRNYRVTPQSPEASRSMYSSYYASSGATAYILSWEPNNPGQQGTREVKLEYLLPGASWTPNYDMTVIDPENVTLAFFAEVHNSALALNGATVFLVAGRVDLSQQVNQVSQVTMNQYAVGYADTTVELPSIGIGTVDLQYVYSLGQVSAEPGDTVYVQLVNSALQARRLVVWNASTDQEAQVIYKVQNSTEIPLAEGIVHIYQDNLFRGSDFIETTPVGSEGSVTVGSLPNVRVRRSEKQEYQNPASIRDYYLHTVTLEIYNYGTEDLSLLVLDGWQQDAWDFAFSEPAPEQGQDNLLRWNVTIGTGQNITLTYQFKTEY
jgi:hypothetical protein